jgi:hypothetical protein
MCGHHKKLIGLGYILVSRNGSFVFVFTRACGVLNGRCSVCVCGTCSLADGSQMRMKQESSEQDQIQHEIH